MTIENWIAIAAIAIPLLAPMVTSQFRKWFSSTADPMKNPAISQMKGVNEREIRRYLLYPSWAICIGSAAGFIWQVGRTDSFTRLDVLLIVSFAFLYLLGLGLVLFANLVAAMARVFEKYDQPKP